MCKTKTRVCSFCCVFLQQRVPKEQIFEYAYLKGSGIGLTAAFVGVFTAFLTAIYSWRLIFKTFHGEYENKKLKIESMHESPFIMLLPLVILGIGSIFAGFFFKELFMFFTHIFFFIVWSIFFNHKL